MKEINNLIIMTRNYQLDTSELRDSLFDNFDRKKRKVRLVGVKVSNLISSQTKDSLFEGKVEKKREDMHKAVDKIKEKFGDSSIYRAGGMS